MAWNLYDLRRKYSHDPASAAIAGTLKMAVVTGIYTPDINLHEFWSSVVANEVAGTGYTAGGNACANPLVTMDVSGNVTFDADDPAAWAVNAAGFSNGRRFILFWDTGVAATSRLHAYSDDFGADKGNVAGEFAGAMDPLGIHTQAR